jgi:glycosyltransferase involved in cell wall biosynthesis
MEPVGAADVELSIVLPAYNEAANVAAMAARLTEIAAPLGSFEIVFVDDGSSDGTLGEIKALARRTGAVRYVSFTRNFGHQAALRAGLCHARGRAVVLMDCDFQHPPELLPALMGEWHKGAKVVTTTRRDEPGSHGFWKRATSRLFYRVLNAIGDVHIEPGSADFLLLDRQVVDTVNRFTGPDMFLRGLVRWLGFPLVTMSYEVGLRQEGESKFTLGRMASLAAAGIVAHSLRPLRLAIYLAFGFVAIGFLLLVYSVVSFLWIAHTVAGWSSLMGTIAIIAAAQMLVLGIIGEYVGRSLRETRHWPAYVVAEASAGGPPDEAGAESGQPAALHRRP